MQVFCKKFGGNIFSLLAGAWLDVRSHAAPYLPANAGSRTIKAAIQKAAQIKKLLVSIMLVFMCSPISFPLRMDREHMGSQGCMLFNINGLEDNRLFLNVSVYP
ncbi:MAG TPA: hypothetical protein VFB76_02675 [Candidatus Angelobacter sp.]|nr:hypothetical protein [Candidatus Angelobacter sp.]